MNIKNINNYSNSNNNINIKNNLLTDSTTINCSLINKIND